MYVLAPPALARACACARLRLRLRVRAFAQNLTQPCLRDSAFAAEAALAKPAAALTQP